MLAGQRDDIALLESDSELGRGDVAPDFELPGIDNETYLLSPFTDYDVVLIIFTCNHCPYMEAKFEELNRLASAYDDFAVVGISPNDAEDRPEDSFEQMQELVADGTIGYTAYLRNESQAIAADYGTVCTPDPFFLENTDDGFEPTFHSRIDSAMSPDDKISDYEIWMAVKALLAGDDIPIEEYLSRGCSIKWKNE